METESSVSGMWWFLREFSPLKIPVKIQESYFH